MTNKTPFFSFFLIISVLLLAATVSAEDDTRISVQFQTLGLTNQNFIIFDDEGDYVFSANTSSTISLDWNESRFYTIQMQPSLTNTDPDIWYQEILNFILEYRLGLFIVFMILFGFALIIKK